MSEDEDNCENCYCRKVCFLFLCLKNYKRITGKDLKKPYLTSNECKTYCRDGDLIP